MRDFSCWSRPTCSTPRRIGGWPSDSRHETGLEVRAEERREFVVEPLVELGPVESRRILADHRLVVRDAGWADREKREVLRMRDLRECMRRFEPRVDRLNSFWLNAVAAGFRAPELDRDRDAGEAFGREKDRQRIGNHSSLDPAAVRPSQSGIPSAKSGLAPMATSPV